MPKNAYKPFSALSARQRRRRLNNALTSKINNMTSDNIANQETFYHIHPSSLSSATSDHHHLQASPIGNVPASSPIKEGNTDITHTDREPVENDENRDGCVYLQNNSEINIETIEPESDSESSETDEPSIENVGFSLREWAVNESVNHKQLTALLKLLNTHKCFSYLPLDARTLLKTPRAYDIKNIGSGQYCHLGIKDSITRILNLYPAVCSAKNCIYSVILMVFLFPKVQIVAFGLF